MRKVPINSKITPNSSLLVVSFIIFSTANFRSKLYSLLIIIPPLQLHHFKSISYNTIIPLYGNHVYYLARLQSMEVIQLGNLFFSLSWSIFSNAIINVTFPLSYFNLLKITKEKNYAYYSYPITNCFLFLYASICIFIIK